MSSPSWWPKQIPGSYADILERVISTFAQGFLASLTLSSPLDIHTWQAASIGGLSAAYSLIRGIAARKIQSGEPKAQLPPLGSPPDSPS